MSQHYRQSSNIFGYRAQIKVTTKRHKLFPESVNRHVWNAYCICRIFTGNPSNYNVNFTFIQQTWMFFKLLATELLFLILAHSVYKMWITQEPNKLELWNKLHLKEKKTGIIHHV